MRTYLLILPILLMMVSCDKKEKQYYSLLSSISTAAHGENLEGIDQNLVQFNKFLETNKVYEGKSFLSKTQLSESVSFLNCVEDYKKVLAERNKEAEIKDRWESNLKQLRTPDQRKKLEEPEKVYANIQARIEKIDGKLKKLEVGLNRSKISCDNAYSKIVSLSKNS